MTLISENLRNVRERVAAAAQRHGRDPGNITLVAVSKTHPAQSVEEAASLGQTAFGENYAQEGASKIAQLAKRSLEWHFIGPLQSNKTRLVAEHFAWAHSIDRPKIAERLAAQRPETRPPLQVCIEINVSGEATKSGVMPEDALPLAKAILLLPRLRLRGLMAIPEPESDFSRQRAAFRRLREIFETLKTAGIDLDTLSMGMSHDFEAAIFEGATLVRIGTAIFGERQ